LPSETMIWQPEFTDKTLSRKPGAVQMIWQPEFTDKTLSRKPGAVQIEVFYYRILCKIHFLYINVKITSPIGSKSVH
ncbi:hypothetical protein OSL56_23415, partial [Escherichia coli]|nr:hypothetical protein [Escherichia coli]